MATVSRRQFLTRGSLGVAAGVAAVAGSGGIASAIAATGPTKAKTSSVTAGASGDAVGGAEPIVAYIRGGASSEVTVMVGHRKVVHRDPELVRRLLSAAG